MMHVVITSAYADGRILKVYGPMTEVEAQNLSMGLPSSSHHVHQVHSLETTRKPMEKRFKARLIDDGSYRVEDLEGARWNMPQWAVTMHLSMNGADAIAATLNREWERFQRNPT